MNVAIFVPRSSSIIYHWVNFAKILNEQGYNIFFITQSDVPISPNNLNFDFTVIEFNNDPSSLNLLKQLSEAANLIKILKDNNIEVIHAFYLKNVFLTLLASFFTKTKNFLHVCGLGNLFNDLKLKNLLYSNLIKIFFALTSRLKDRIFIVETAYLKNKLEKEFFMQKENIYQICGTGIDTEKFLPETTPLSPMKFITVTRLLKDKGVIEYMDAVESIQKEFPNTEFTLVGMWWETNPLSISKKEFERLQDLNINYFENINNVYEILPKNHFFILPSYHEGLSVSSMEAASCGLGLLLSDISGCRELVHSDKNGYLFKKQSSTALIDAIRKAIKNFNKVNAFGAYSRNLIKEKHSIKVLSTQVCELYKQKIG